MKYPQKYGRPEISTTYCSDIVMQYIGGAHGVMVIVAGNGHGDSSSNPG